LKETLVKTLTSTLAAAAALLMGSTAAHADKCVGLEKFAAEKPGLSAKPAFLQLKAAGEAPPPGVDCSSLSSVFKRVVDGTRTGGRKLEEDKPFDRAEAQANLEKALENPEVRAQLEKLQHDVPDETTRLLYEAAVLDSEGFYDARELRIHQLREKVGG
jgi:hypothetical protein